MIRSRPDRWFDRFRRTGDARLLAKVFDATAPELWRVAVHLCRDSHAAEDAVQGTFLSALESKASWDASRPLVPWLLGHLANRVREQRRGAQRVPDPTRFEPAVERDPADIAADREVAAVCQDALLQLAEPYRSTLAQHLVHGRTLPEIAAELGVPAGTVRMRLHRGLDQLRQKLPVGVVAGRAWAAPLSPPSLVAMREAVLGSVPGVAAVVGSGHAVSLVLGVLGMNKLMWSVAISAAVLASWWWAWPAGAVVPVPRAERVVAAEPAPRTEAPEKAPATAEPAVVAVRTEVTAGAPAGAAGRLRVAVRNAGNGQPVRGARVDVRDASRRAHARSQPAATAATSAPMMKGARASASSRRTGDDGAVTMALATGSVEVTIEEFAIEPRRVEVTADTDVELVVDLPVALDADVLVCDADDQPVPGARLVGFTERDLDAGGTTEFGRSDAAGRFRAPFVESAVTLRAIAVGRAASPAVELRPGSPRATLRLGAAEAVVAGTVFGPDGAPLADAPVAIQELPRANGDAAPLVVRTDARGRFEAHHVPPGPCLVLAARLLADGQSRLAQAEATAVAGATTHVDVRFGAGARFEVQLRRADGSAVAGEYVMVWLRHQGIAERFARLGMALVVTDDHGDGAACGLMPGRYEVQVSMPTALVRETFELAEGEVRRFVPSFADPGAGTITATVVDGAQRPLAGWLVRLAGRNGAANLSATTDRDGRVTFRGLAESGYRLRVLPAEQTFAVIEREVATGATVTLVAPDEAQRRGSIRGVLVASRGGSLAGVRVLVHRAEGDRGASTEQVEVACDATTGVFAIEHVPAGIYHVAACAAGAKQPLATRLNIDVGAHPVDLGRLALGAGSLVVRAAFVDGRAAADVVVAVGNRGVFVAPPPTAGALPGVIGDLPSGSLDVLVWGRTIAPVTASAEVRVGEAVELPVVVTPAAPITVRFEQGQGEGTLGLLRVRQGGAVVVAVWIEAQEPLVRGFAPGSYELELEPRRGSRLVGHVAVGGDRAPGEVVLRAP